VTQFAVDGIVCQYLRVDGQQISYAARHSIDALPLGQLTWRRREYNSFAECPSRRVKSPHSPQNTARILARTLPVSVPRATQHNGEDRVEF
jgi:hypothetical protein